MRMKSPDNLNDTKKLNEANKTPQHHRLALITLCLAVLVAQIDTAIINLATHSIASDLNIGVSTLQWIIDSYNLVYAIFLLTGGALADLYGRRFIFMIGAAIFTIASLICAAAPTAFILIIGRSLAGLGAALLIPSSLAIIRVTWLEATERGRILGIWAACNGLAFVIGPTLGGLLISHFSWRSIFIVVIPVSIVVLALGPFSIKESSDPQGRHIDGLAQFLGAITLGSIAFSAIQFHMAQKTAMIAFFLALITLSLFIHVEGKKGTTALVPLDIFKSSSFCGAMIATAGMTFGMYGLLFILPLTWLSSGQLDVSTVGVALIPMALVFAIVSPFSSTFSHRYGLRKMATGGSVIISLGLLLISASANYQSIIFIEIGLTLTGLGMGCATGPLMNIAISSTIASRSGTASALINAARMFGATTGVAILGAIFTMANGGTNGLQLAMLGGAIIQIICTIIAWKVITDS
jgi:EmrB/QacA subfamily drug resistance transporter